MGEVFLSFLLAVFSVILYILIRLEETLLSVLFVFFTIVFYVLTQYFRNYNYWKERGVPCPSPVPFFGNTFSITCGNEPLFHFHLKNYFKFRNERISGYYDLGKPVLVVRDLELISHILNKDFMFFQDRGLPYDPKEPLTMNLFNVGGEKWKNVRMKVSSCFTTVKRKLMFAMIINIMKDLKETFDTAIAKNKEIEIKDILTRFSTDVITECAFGIKANTLKNPESEFRQMGRSLVLSNSRLRPIILEICPKIMRFFGMRFLPKQMNDFFISFVKDAIEFRKHNHVNRNDFLNSMIELMEKQNTEQNEPEKSEGITYASIAAECWFFFFAGFEASALVLSKALFELARNSDIQQQLWEEVNTVLEKYNGEVTYDALAEMTYMDMIINETIRLYPSLSTLTRRCSKPYKIPGTDVTIDQGVNVVLPVVGIHRDPLYYKNPEKFNPLNFADDVKNTRHHCAFLPFGEGPRICVASRFGMVQIKSALATVIKNFEFTPSPKMQEPLPFIPRFILTSVEDVWVKCSKRTIQT